MEARKPEQKASRCINEAFPGENWNLELSKRCPLKLGGVVNLTQQMARSAPSLHVLCAREPWMEHPLSINGSHGGRDNSFPVKGVRLVVTAAVAGGLGVNMHCKCRVGEEVCVSGQGVKEGVGDII